MRINISYEYIRGLIEGEGTFTFSPQKKSNTIIPEFILKMHFRDRMLFEIIKEKLELKNNIYEYYHPGSDGANRSANVMLIVREIGNIKNIIVPLFYKKLIGNKADSFEKWIEKIGTDPLVPNSYKFIYKLYKSGFYDKINKFD